MSILAPDDTVVCLTQFVRNAEACLNDLPLHRRLILKGCIIDMQDLIAEIIGGPRIDTHQAAIDAIKEEARKGQA